MSLTASREYAVCRDCSVHNLFMLKGQLQSLTVLHHFQGDDGRLPWVGASEDGCAAGLDSFALHSVLEEYTGRLWVCSPSGEH